MRKNTPVDCVTNEIQSMYWLNSRLGKLEKRIGELEHSTEELIQNTAWGAKKIQNMHVLMRARMTAEAQACFYRSCRGKGT